MSIVDTFLVGKLIDLVRVHTCVYDPRDPQHNNRTAVNSAWRYIAAEMNVPETQCREKWANLRSNFARELRKARRKISEEGGAKGRPSQWVFFEAMGFLAPYVRSRLDTFETEGRSSPTEELPVNVKVEEEGSSSCGETEGGGSSTGLAPQGTLVGFSLKRKEPDLLGSCWVDQDDDRLFLLSLLPKMRRLPVHDNLRFRIDVQTLLLQRLVEAERERPSGAEDYERRQPGERSSSPPESTLSLRRDITHQED